MVGKKMPYWRDSAFETLDKFSKELRENPDYILLAEYAALKEKGLRKQAYTKLNGFIALTCSFADTKRRELVHLICQRHEQWEPFNLEQWEPFNLFNTYPLINKVILPTLKQWIADEPQNPEPLKWLGLYYYGDSNYSINDSGYFTALERSLSLNSNDDIVRKVLIRRYLDCIDYSIHEVISDSYYIGDPSEDLVLCSTIEEHLQNLPDKNVQITLSEQLKGYRHMIQDWQKYISANVKMSFTEWRCSKKLP